MLINVMAPTFSAVAKSKFEKEASLKKSRRKNGGNPQLLQEAKVAI